MYYCSSSGKLTSKELLRSMNCYLLSITAYIYTCFIKYITLLARIRILLNFEAQIQSLSRDQLLLSQHLPRGGSETQLKLCLFIEHKGFNHPRNSQRFVIKTVFLFNCLMPIRIGCEVTNFGEFLSHTFVGHFQVSSWGLPLNFIPNH